MADSELADSKEGRALVRKLKEAPFGPISSPRSSGWGFNGDKEFTMAKHPRLISVDRIARYQGMPENRRHAIMMGWVDPVTIPPIYAACDDFELNHLLSKGGFGVGCWRQPELLGPLIAQCDLDIRRAEELV